MNEKKKGFGRPRCRNATISDLAICAKIGPISCKNLTTHSLSDCCDPLLAKATGTLANAPAKPVIRIRLVSCHSPWTPNGDTAELFLADLAYSNGRNAKRSGGQLNQAARWKFSGRA